MVNHMLNLIAFILFFMSASRFEYKEKNIWNAPLTLWSTYQLSMSQTCTSYLRLYWTGGRVSGLGKQVLMESSHEVTRFLLF